MMQKISAVWSKLQSTAPFTEGEAWGLFRLAALGEAVGWALLITGIAVRWHGGLGSGVAVPVAGQIHGMLFLCYFAVLLATCTSLRWSWRRFIVAALAGVVPFGTFLFEQWASWHIQSVKSRLLYRLTLLYAWQLRVG